MLPKPLQDVQSLIKVIDQHEGAGRNDDGREIVIVVKILKPRLLEVGRQTALIKIGLTYGEHLRRMVEALDG